MIIEDKGKAIAVAPLMYSKYNFLHFGNLRKIEFIGSPQSDYNNFIFLEKEQECLKLFWDYLTDKHADWNFVELGDIPESATFVSLLRTMSTEELSGVHLDEVITFSCPYIDLPISIEMFLQRLSGNMRRNLRRRKKRLSEKYRVEVKTHSDFSSIEEAMDAFYELHQKRWETQDLPGVFAEKKLRDFHYDIARHFSKKEWLSLYILTADDLPIAAIYSFNYKQKKYEYLTGFDPEYSKYGVANLLRMHVVEECIRKGLKEYDLMRGDETYKISWNAKSRKNLEFRLIRKGLFPRIYGWITKSVTATLLAQKLGKSLTLRQ
ncbi:GNAT family N-acetyltransferase [Candidatus Bathyarchaeota archaeon]|nr:GNAT family N-acetyltransferase [Candidatus Bathyarchaeota archaeon]